MGEFVTMLATKFAEWLVGTAAVEAGTFAAKAAIWAAKTVIVGVPLLLAGKALLPKMDLQAMENRLNTPLKIQFLFLILIVMILKVE